ncbi:MAG TPA: hypothetical protein PL033_09680 [Candidatus Brocadiia bacterium]|nr:hypothetical protein [Candidatus Brocadiia bacterium]
MSGFPSPALILAASEAMQTAGWQPWAYQYIIGGTVFAIGMALCVKTKQIDLATSRGKKTFALMLVGLVVYALLQGFMQMVLPYI